MVAREDNAGRVDIAAAMKIDALGSDFDSAWRQGLPPRIETLLPLVDESLRDELLVELLSIEIEYRRRAGELPQASEYLSRFSENGRQVQMAFEGADDSNSSADEGPGESSAPSRQGRTVCAWSGGDTIGDYTLIEPLGAGGMGEVFKAHHPAMDRIVALKAMSSKILGDAESAKRFQQEVRASARLVHPNIVTAFDAGDHHGVPYLVMEYIEGRDLNSLLKSDGPLPVSRAVGLVLQAAQGMVYAHAAGIIHRDLKPANLLLSDSGELKILDLGLARFESTSETSLTCSGQIMGTIDFMAPEQVDNSHTASQAADVYSLGCTLYWLLAGEPIYLGQTLVEKVLAHRAQPTPRLSDRRADVPPALDGLFGRMVAKQSSDRPTMAEVVAELDAVCKSLGHESSVVEVRPRRSKARKRWGAASVGGVLLLLAVALVGNRGRETPQGSFHAQRTPGGATDSWLASPPKPIAMHADPTFPTWLQATSLLPVEEQKAAVRKKVTELNPSFRGDMIIRVDPQGKADMVSIMSYGLTDISPIQVFTEVRDFRCYCRGNRSPLCDLSPVQGMKRIRELRCNNTKVSDLSPLRGMQLNLLDIDNTDVSDLSPLAGMPLETLICTRTRVTDYSPVHECKRLKVVVFSGNLISAENLAAVKKALPDCEFREKTFPQASSMNSSPNPIALNSDPTFPEWLQATSLLPVEEQKAAVLAKLMELNPEHEGGMGTKVTNGKVKIVNVSTTKVSDLSPVQVFQDVEELRCFGGNSHVRRLKDLSPLQGMKLTQLSCGNSGVSDLSPLRGMPLTSLNLENTEVSDLSPLAGMPLWKLTCTFTRVTDLSPLQECKRLRLLVIAGSPVTEESLAALKQALPDCEILGKPVSATTAPSSPLKNSQPSKADLAGGV